MVRLGLMVTKVKEKNPVPAPCLNEKGETLTVITFKILGLYHSFKLTQIIANILGEKITRFSQNSVRHTLNLLSLTGGAAYGIPKYWSTVSVTAPSQRQ